MATNSITNPIKIASGRNATVNKMLIIYLLVVGSCRGYSLYTILIPNLEGDHHSKTQHLSLVTSVRDIDKSRPIFNNHVAFTSR